MSTSSTERKQERERERKGEKQGRKEKKGVSHITQNCIISRKKFPTVNWAYHIQMIIILLNKL